jgi:mannose/fructose/N-acetylgalactosamine-specific phosphotransferase system component IIC
MKYLKSLVELVVLTYATSFLGLLMADGFDLTNVSSLKVAGISALPAALAVLYGALSKLLGNSDSAVVVDTRSDVADVDPSISTNS